MDKIEFNIDDTDEKAELYILEQTTINGTNYVLAAEEEEGDSDCYILEEVSVTDDGEVTYEMIEDENILESISKVFEELLEDVDFEL